MPRELFTAIIFRQLPGMKAVCVKYHNVAGDEKSFRRLVNYVRKTFKSADHINLYYKKSREFYKQIDLKKDYL